MLLCLAVIGFVVFCVFVSVVLCCRFVGFAVLWLVLCQFSKAAKLSDM